MNRTVPSSRSPRSALPAARPVRRWSAGCGWAAGWAGPSSDWYPLFPNPVVAESLLDRLINASHQVIMNGPSYRPNKRPKNGS